MGRPSLNSGDCIASKYFPTSRKSISAAGEVKPFGPHQRRAITGSVQAFQTSSRGASKARSIMSTRSSAVVGASVRSAIPVLLLRDLAAVFLLLLLQFLQVGVQAIEAFLPIAAIALEPLVGILERPRFEPAGAPLRLSRARDETGALQHLEVLGDGGQGHLEGLGQLRNGGFAGCQAREDSAPGGVGQCSEGAAYRIGCCCGRHGRI